MIKIIDDKPHHSVVRQVICRNCGVTLEYTPNDVLERKVSDYGGGTDTYRWLSCPKCTKDVPVS